MKKLTSLITVIAITFLFTGCAMKYHLVNDEDYQLKTDSNIEKTVHQTILNGGCIPIELKTVILPALEKIDAELAKDEVTITIKDICEIIELLDKESAKNVLLYNMLVTTLHTLSKDYNLIGNICIPLNGDRLSKARSISAMSLMIMRITISLADISNRWCE